MRKAAFTAVAGILLAGVSSALAGEDGFATTSEGIVERLAQPSFVTRGSTEPAVRGPKTRALRIPGPSSRPATRGVKVMERTQGEVIASTIQVPFEEKAASVNLKIEFDVNSHSLRPESVALLDQLGEALGDARLSGKRFQVRGHTDSDGGDDYNLRLSFFRAETVRHYLIANHGIDGERLRVLGFGETSPLGPNDSLAHKQLNRRVEVVATP